jgi:cytochrome c-type biogenesis protein CcmH/NrfG
VLALLDEARADAAGGNLDNAADSLERAIRIQPYHPLLWQQLAEIRLRQGQPGLAEELARKSSRHAGGNEEILRKNQAIIGEARRLLGTPDVPAEP